MSNDDLIRDWKLFQQASKELMKPLEPDIALPRDEPIDDLIERTIAALQAEPEGWISLLRSARCPDPNCDNNGVITVEGTRVGHGCCGHFLSNGECCGNAVPVPEYDVQQEQCRWCYERDSLLPAAPADKEEGK